MPEGKNEVAGCGATLDEIRNGSAPCLPPVILSHNHSVFFQVTCFYVYFLLNRTIKVISSSS
jgi:hypothetical protein